MTTVKEQQASYLKVIEASQVIKQKLGEFIPEDPKKVSDTDVFSIENLENIISEISKLKMNQNNIELQLYEANEKIADLLEHVSFNGFLKSKVGNKNRKLYKNFMQI